jgi:hypothetical protein
MEKRLMDSTRIKVGAASPNASNANTSSTDLASLVATVASEVGDVFAWMDWADDEIERASRRHPDQADALHHAFGLVRPRDIATGMGAEFVYRSHVRELLERVATGADTRIPTAAEMCLVCTQVSGKVPLHGAAAGLYFRLWLQAFPDLPIIPTQATQQVHYERLHGTRIDEYEATLRRKATDPHRLLAGIVCAGRHHGRNVTCRYAANTTSRRHDRHAPHA